MADNNGDRPLVIDESDRTHSVEDLVRISIWSNINPIVAIRPPGFVYKVLLRRQGAHTASNEPEVMEQDSGENVAVVSPITSVENQQAQGGFIVDPDLLVDPNMPSPMVQSHPDQQRPPPTQRPAVQTRRPKITTNRPIVRNYQLGHDVETTSLLEKLSQKARESAARRAVELEENNPNKVICSPSRLLL